MAHGLKRIDPLAAALILGAIGITVMTRASSGGDRDRATSERVTHAAGAVPAATWVQWLSSGTRVGPPQAPVQFVVRANRQCADCARIAATLTALRYRLPDHVAITKVTDPGLHPSNPATYVNGVRIADLSGPRVGAMADSIVARADEVGANLTRAFRAQ